MAKERTNIKISVDTANRIHANRGVGDNFDKILSRILDGFDEWKILKANEKEKKIEEINKK